MILYIAARLCVVTMHHTTIQQRSTDSTDLLSTINLATHYLSLEASAATSINQLLVHFQIYWAFYNHKQLLNSLQWSNLWNVTFRIHFTNTYPGKSSGGHTHIMIFLYVYARFKCSPFCRNELS